MRAMNLWCSALVIWTVSLCPTDGRSVEWGDFLAIQQEIIEIKAERLSFNDKIVELETQVKAGEAKVSRIEELLRMTETKLHKTEERQQTTANKLTRTEETVRSVKEELKDALARIAELEKSDTKEAAPVKESSEYPSLQADGSISMDIQSRTNRSNSIKRRFSGGNHLQHHPSKRSNNVAFSAFLETNLNNLGHQNTIKFDRVAINEGNAFDSRTGIFVCPNSGGYMFQSAVLSATHERVDTEIVKNGYMLARMYAAGNPTGVDGYDQGFNSAITYCNQGEHVWVRIVESYGTALHGSSFTSFSGYQLW